jgi:DNA-directed RNA polymerase subunit RPC12/RpoP
MTEYPFICKECHFEIDLEYAIKDVPDNSIKCPNCGKKKLVQNIAKKLRSTNTIIPPHMQASSSEGNNPMRKGYGKKKKEVW